MSDRPVQERDLIRLLAKLPTPKKQASLPLCACDKMVSPGTLTVFNTGVLQAVDNVCPGCTKTYAGFARIVCCTCRMVVARVAPGKDPVDGFIFRKDVTYHTETCGACDPAQKSTLIIEKFLYQKKFLGKPRIQNPST